MRRVLWTIPVAGFAAAVALLGGPVVTAQKAGDPPAAQVKALVPAAGDLKQSVSLPITQVALFSSGVGYFARFGEVEGDAQVDLTFPERDINDLLKSMALRDFGNGQITAVSYDSREPIDRTLASFAINLNNNPTLSGILMQARGESVEIVLSQQAAGQPGTVVGKVIGVETKQIPPTKGEPARTEEVVNVWSADGVRAVKLTDAQRIRFQNPELEREVRRALEVLSLNHDQAKKAVRLSFTGEGKRNVRVGYVVENPVWKTTYRLELGKDAKPFVQAWAVVENPTDEDWAGVRMSLISGRPISFRMDLYNPLYVTRPVVEPELFASLRPPTYSGDMAKDGKRLEALASETREEAMAMDAAPPAPMAAAPGFGGGGGGFGGGVPGGAPMGGRARALRKSAAADKLAELEAGTAGLRTSVMAAATASRLGDNFQYAINTPVDLPRQKSALLSIFNGEITADPVSIYNPSVQAKHPLLGLRLTNSTKLHLMQGPITVYENGTYAGDTRILDLQPKEERLVSYAIDLGSEVSPKNNDTNTRITQVKVQKGIVFTNTRIREEKVYTIVNRSERDRKYLIEHPNRKNAGFRFVGDNKPKEETDELYRFAVSVAAGKGGTLTVTEERDEGSSIALSNSNDDQIRYFISLAEVTEPIKVKLQETLTLKAKMDESRRDLQKVAADIQRISTDQTRLRQNIRELPQQSEAYKRYLRKFDDQEREMDTLTEKQKELQNAEYNARVKYETFLANLSVE